MLTGMNCFFNNKFSEAKEIFEKRAKEYVYFDICLKELRLIYLVIW